MADYVQWLRSKVGKAPVILNCAGACVLDEAGRVLMHKRTPSDDSWSFPGGMMEYGESAMETAVREVREETGYEIAIDGLMGVYTHYFETYPNGDQAQPIVFCFLGHVIGGQPTVDYHETYEVAFFDLDEAPIPYNQQHRDILADLKAKKRGIFR